MPPDPPWCLQRRPRCAPWTAAGLLLLATGCGRSPGLLAASGGPGGTATGTTGTGTSTTSVSTSTTGWDTGVLDTGWDDTGWADSGWMPDHPINPCNNGVRDGNETDVDCGGPMCAPCMDGQSCLLDRDCQSDLCTQGVCGCTAWSETLATAADDVATDVLATGAGVFAVGRTGGALTAMPPAGGDDPFIAISGPGAAPFEPKQAGTPGDDTASSVSRGPGNVVYVAGSTIGQLGQDPAAGGPDAFLQRWDVSGTLLWTRQLGSALTERGVDAAYGFSGAVAFVGDWHDALGDQTDPTGSAVFVARVTGQGDVLWQRLLNSPADDHARAVAITPDGETVVVGDTLGQLGDDPAAGSQDLFVARFPKDGPALWVRQLGTPSWDGAADVAVDADGMIYVLAQSSGTLLGANNVGGRDVFLIQLDGDGMVQWAESLGTTSNDYGAGVDDHPDGGVVIAGRVIKPLDGQAGFGSWDLFVARYDVGGTQLWTRQLGSAGDDRTTSLFVHPTGAMLLSASSTGDLAGPNQGGLDGAVLQLCE